MSIGWRLGLLVSAAVAAAVAAARAEDAAQTAGRVLELGRRQQGLCVHVGCGQESSAALTAELAAAGGMLVHGLAPDEPARRRAVEAIEARGVVGQASVAKLAGATLPLSADLASLVVVEDASLPDGRKVPPVEIERITAPGGAICVLADGTWTRTVKPRPEGMDDWRHPMHDAGNTWSSKDRFVRFPIELRWTDGMPKNITGFTDCRSWVVAGDRLFTVSTNQVENLGRKGDPDQWLCARDAFNGLPLWKINLKVPDDGKAISWYNTAPLATDGRHVYTAMGERKVAKVDAASGKVLWARETKYPAYKLVLSGGAVVVGCWGEKERIWFKWYPKAGPGSVEAFDADTGKPRWRKPVTPYQLLAAGGVAYIQVKSDKTPHVAAVDLATGEQLWRAGPKEGEKTGLSLNAAGEGFVVISSGDQKKRTGWIAALSPRTGEQLWRQDTRYRPNAWVAVVDGRAWVNGQKLDPLTGKSDGKIGTWLGGRGCCPQALVGPYLIKGRGGSSLKLPAGSARETETLSHAAVRSACAQGMTPANGMLYTAQNNCKCIPAHLYGFLALGPAEETPTAADFAKPRPAEQGPAFGKVSAPPSDAEGSWPTLRADAARSAAAPTKLPAELRERWNVNPLPAKEGPLAGVWRAGLTAPLSAPVVGAGKVFVSARDLGQIIALDAAKGERRWAVTLPSRLDGPPTLHRGYCLVGCHDGWVYALRVTDGQLAWRASVAPAERRIVANGRVESLWPATASVLAHEDTIYATAGRATEIHGGIAVVALNLHTGRTVWGRSITGVHRLNDVLSLRDGKLRWRFLTLDPATGRTLQAASSPSLKSYGGGKGALEGAIIDGTYTVIRNRRAGRAFAVGAKPFDLLAFDAARRVGPRGAVSADGSPLWQRRLPGRVMGIALAENLAVFACRGTRAYAPDAKGNLRLVSPGDGRMLATVALDASPTYDGLALAAGRVYVSLRTGRVICLDRTATPGP